MTKTGGATKTTVGHAGEILSGTVMTTTGIAVKVAWPGRLDRLSIALYLAISWSVVLVYEEVARALPSSTLGLLAAGFGWAALAARRRPRRTRCRSRAASTRTTRARAA